MKPREFWILFYENAMTIFTSSYEARSVPEHARFSIIHVKEVCSEKEIAIEKMVEALESYKEGWVEGMMNDRGKKALNALEAWRKANK